MKSILILRYLLAIAVVATIFTSCGKDDDGGGTTTITGCTDSEAENYNADATDRTVGGMTARDQFIGPWQVPTSNFSMSLRIKILWLLP